MKPHRSSSPKASLPGFALSLAWLAFACLVQTTPAQDFVRPHSLPRYFFRNGEETLRAFAPVSEATRHSIVELDVDGDTVALGTVMDTNGLALTKASELKPGKLTCWLAGDKAAEVEVLSVDEDEDLALVRVDAQGLKPIQWAKDKIAVGQWAITPGTEETPRAVGIVSALSRRIRPPRGLIGVTFDQEATIPRISLLEPGLGAEKAGLKPGDVIVAVNDATVTNREEVRDMLGNFRIGRTVKIKVQRGDKQIEAGVKLVGEGTVIPGFERFAMLRANRMNGEVSQRAGGFDEAIEHDTVLDPRFCGGPLVNLDNKAIGLNIARADRDATYALPAELVKRVFENLKLMPEAVKTSKEAMRGP